MQESERNSFNPAGKEKDMLFHLPLQDKNDHPFKIVEEDENQSSGKKLRKRSTKLKNENQILSDSLF